MPPSKPSLSAPQSFRGDPLRNDAGRAKLAPQKPSPAAAGAPGGSASGRPAPRSSRNFPAPAPTAQEGTSLPTPRKPRPRSPGPPRPRGRRAEGEGRARAEAAHSARLAGSTPAATRKELRTGANNREFGCPCPTSSDPGGDSRPPARPPRPSQPPRPHSPSAPGGCFSLGRLRLSQPQRPAGAKPRAEGQGPLVHEARRGLRRRQTPRLRSR